MRYRHFAAFPPGDGIGEDAQFLGERLLSQFSRQTAFAKLGGGLFGPFGVAALAGDCGPRFSLGTG
jgi:hypothetical protein